MRGRLGVLGFDGGGNTDFVAMRVAGAILLTREESSDGRCDSDDPARCGPEVTELARFPIPDGVSITERFHEVEGKGAEHDLECAGAKPE